MPCETPWAGGTRGGRGLAHFFAVAVAAVLPSVCASSCVILAVACRGVAHASCDRGGRGGCTGKKEKKEKGMTRPARASLYPPRLGASRESRARRPRSAGLRHSRRRARVQDASRAALSVGVVVGRRGSTRAARLASLGFACRQSSCLEPRGLVNGHQLLCKRARRKAHAMALVCHDGLAKCLPAASPMASPIKTTGSHGNERRPGPVCVVDSRVLLLHASPSQPAARA